MLLIKTAVFNYLGFHTRATVIIFIIETLTGGYMNSVKVIPETRKETGGEQ